LANTSRSLSFSSLPKLAILFTLLAASCISVADLSTSDQANADAKGLFLESIEWGRIVDVYDVGGDLVEEDVLVDHLATSSSVISLSANAVTQKESLFIQFPEASAEFSTLLLDLKTNLQTISRRDVLGELTYDMSARNAAVRLNFNLAIDPGSVDSSSVQVFHGSSKDDLAQFPVRYVVKNNSSTNTSHKGGILVDPTVSQSEAAEEQLPANVIGFGQSSDLNDYNLVIYIPTRIDLVNGVYSVLSTVDGAFGPSRKNDSEPVQITGLENYMLLAALRTGNYLDSFKGFMRDAIRPSLLGIKNSTITSHAVSGSNIDVVYSIDAVNCQGLAPKIGDVFEVVDNLGKNNVWTVVSIIDPVAPFYNVRCVNSDYSSGSQYSPVVAGRLSTRYSAVDSNIQACYLDIIPNPVASLPVGGILDDATVLVHFDEAIDPATMLSMSTFVIVQPDDLLSPDPQNIKETEAAWYRQVDASESVADFIERQRGYDYRVTTAGPASPDSEYGGRILFGQVISSDSNRTFSITPVSGWQDLDTTDAFDEYVVALRDGVNGIKDMSGNQIKMTSFVAGNDGQNIQLSILHQNPQNARYFSLLFGAVDEDGDGNAEWAGQVNATDFPGKHTGRPPSRFTVAADNSQLALANAGGNGSAADGTAPSEPLIFAGAVVMNVYRPEDFGFGYEDVTEFNYSIEGLSWSPLDGLVYDENYNEISLALSHSFSMPDNMFVTPPVTVVWPQSGMLTSSFNDNVLGFTANGQSGIDELNMFSSAYYVRAIDKYRVNGIEYLPWPDFTSQFVWRDTAFDQAYHGGRGASAGAPTDNYITMLGQWDPIAKRYAPGSIPTVALPLQCRFRTYPQVDALSLNAFRTTLMMNPAATTPKLPMFRIYSAGGQDATGTWQRVQPDQAGESGGIPIGGYRNGLPTAEVGDDLVYWAAADFSVEVSRMHSHWFDISGPLNTGTINGVLIEPAAEDQPTGTSVEIEYRGSLAVAAGNNPFENKTPLNDASVRLGVTGSGGNAFDHYGDFVALVGTVATPSAWTTDITELEGQGYSFIQVRVSFMSNADLDLRPTLDGLGIVWTN
jgi:hypothetical protein